jgi:hypothetical protein
MKECPYCGKEYPDGATVCEIDANPLVASKVATTALGGEIHRGPSSQISPAKLHAGHLLAMGRWRFYLWFATISSIALGVLSFLALILGLPGFFMIFAIPFGCMEAIAAYCSNHNIDLKNMSAVWLGFGCGLVFLQWFPVGLVIAYLYRLYRSRSCK